MLQEAGTGGQRSSEQPQDSPGMANCSLAWEIYNGDISDHLMLFYIVYCCFICFLGTLCNVMVIWSVVGCPRTRLSIKVLLCGLFSSTLLMCLLVMPFVANIGIAKVLCDRQIPIILIHVMVVLYVVLTEAELIYITIMAILRTLAVWSSNRRHVTVRTAVTLLVATALYSTIATLLILWALWMKQMDADTLNIIHLIYTSVHILAPVLIILACYFSMMLAVWHNKQRLAASQHVATAADQTKVMDQATRAMLAVFVSNLFFVLPHSVYHILPQDLSLVSYVIVHCFFYTHLFVDPLAYLCFNVHHRRRALHTLASCIRWATCRHPASSYPHSASTLPLHATPSTSPGEPRRKHG